MRCPHQTAYRQIEAGRAVLALIVAVGREVQQGRRQRRMLEDMRDRTVDLGVAPAALLVGRTAAVADAGQYQPMLYSRRVLLVAGEPCDGADRARRE